MRKIPFAANGPFVPKDTPSTIAVNGVIASCYWSMDRALVVVLCLPDTVPFHNKQIIESLVVTNSFTSR